MSSSSSHYAIFHEKLDLYIKIMDIESLHLHEETIAKLLDELVEEIQRDGLIKHPVIVDQNSYVVLDGMHRVAALERLGCKRVPVCIVDYGSPSIRVGCWYRTIKGERAVERVLAETRRINFEAERTERLDPPRIGVPPVFAALEDLDSSFLLQSPFRSLKEAYDFVKKIEEQLKNSALEIGYETEVDALRKLREGVVDAVLLTPRLSKEAVVETALSGKLFFHKATRHVIPARPLYVNVPLDVLLSNEPSLERVNEELVKMLKEKRLRRVSAGSLVEGRRYEEDLYIFEGRR